MRAKKLATVAMVFSEWQQRTEARRYSRNLADQFRVRTKVKFALRKWKINADTAKRRRLAVRHAEARHNEKLLRWGLRSFQTSVWCKVVLLH